MLPPEEMVELVRKVCPDILAEPSEEPSSLLLPELNLQVLQAERGKGLVAVMQTRVLDDPSVDQGDLALMQKLDQEGKMPIFSGAEVNGKDGDAFAGTLAFVHEGRIIQVGQDKPEEQKAESRRMIAEGVVVDANQYISKNVRQTLLLQFCCGIADQYVASPKVDNRAEDLQKALAANKLSEETSKALVDEKPVILAPSD